MLVFSLLFFLFCIKFNNCFRFWQAGSIFLPFVPVFFLELFKNPCPEAVHNDDWIEYLNLHYIVFFYREKAFSCSFLVYGLRNAAFVLCSTKTKYIFLLFTSNYAETSYIISGGTICASKISHYLILSNMTI